MTSWRNIHFSASRSNKSVLERIANAGICSAKNDQQMPRTVWQVGGPPVRLALKIMKIKPTTKAGQVLVQLDRKDEGLLDQAAAFRPGPASPVSLKKILVPVDFSHCSKEALDFAVPFARQFGSRKPGGSSCSYSNLHGRSLRHKIRRI